jgi:hypothetical protein
MAELIACSRCPASINEIGAAVAGCHHWSDGVCEFHLFSPCAERELPFDSRASAKPE